MIVMNSDLCAMKRMQSLRCLLNLIKFDLLRRQSSHFITPFFTGCPNREAKPRNAAFKVEFSRFKKNISKELVEENNQVSEKIQKKLKAYTVLRTAEETKMKLLSEKSSLEKKIVELKKMKSSEDKHA